MKAGFVVAIDGPVASGKGTIATLLAKKIQAVNINTGGMYRALALKCRQEGIELTDTERILEYLTLRHINISYHPRQPFISTILLDSEDVTTKLATPELSMDSSTLARNEHVGRRMSQLQREIAMEIISNGVPVVMEGRQIGTEVIPDAHVKIYLTANLTVRGQRRFEQYVKQGIKKTLSEIVQETKARDNQDMSRVFGPLVKNPEQHGYMVLDNSSMDENDTLSVIIGELLKKGLYKNE